MESSPLDSDLLPFDINMSSGIPLSTGAVETEEETDPTGEISHIYPGADLVPLDVFPSSLPRRLVRRALSYRFAIMTPRVLPSRNVSNPYLQYWFPMSLNDQATFKAIVLSSLSHERINGLISANMASLTSTKEVVPYLKQYYLDTITSINEALHDPARATADATILAVLMMVEKPLLQDHKEWSKRSPFQAPLHGLQWLDVHSAREPNPVHQMGLHKIISLRGGLAQVKTPGLAAAAFYRVLVNSTLLLSPPPLPFVALSGQNASEIENHLLLGTMNLVNRLNVLDKLPLESELRQVMHGLRAYTANIDDYISGRSPSYSPQAMCDQRNLVQYHLMSIRPIADTGLGAISEVCRLVTIIYSIGVTFPLSGVRAPFGTLAKTLQSELEKNDLINTWPMLEHGDILFLWILMVGGIAARDGPGRGWFIECLSEIMFVSENVQWSCVKEKLRMILWLDIACDMAGRDVWSEAHALLQKRAQRTKSVPLSPIAHQKLKAPCAHCRSKKIKCDKDDPCQNCVRSGLSCGSAGASAAFQARVHVFSMRQKPCDLCRRRRVRCDKEKPCKRCKDGGFRCVYREDQWVESLELRSSQAGCS
ncbi:transcriptional regulator family: Fungal Specific TF [Aspergillus niger]|nr:transcriptional regulator family: Fungal Specific TF [Aspergillus niger]